VQATTRYQGPHGVTEAAPATTWGAVTIQTFTVTESTEGVPVASPWSAPEVCRPHQDGGGCYYAGDLCPHSTRGVRGTAGDKVPILCELVDGWRWEMTFT
jgi:hypothetical protein